MENKELFDLKKDFVKYVHDLKREQIKLDFDKQTSIVALKQLLGKNEITKDELIELWKNGKKMFTM